MGKRLYVGNLSYNATEADLRDLFAESGNVTDVKVVLDRETGRPRGFAFVEMASDSEASAGDAVAQRSRRHGPPDQRQGSAGALRRWWWRRWRWWWPRRWWWRVAAAAAAVAAAAIVAVAAAVAGKRPASTNTELENTGARHPAPRDTAGARFLWGARDRASSAGFA